MKKPAVVILLSLLLSCDKDGDIIDTYGTKLISIHYSDDRSSWTEKFTYDEFNRLTQVADINKVTGKKYNLEYENGKLFQYTKFDIYYDKVVGRDSMAYNKKGQLEKIYSFTNNSVSSIFAYEFDYDSLGYLNEKKSFFVELASDTSVEKYFWENGNIVRSEEYHDGELYYEFFYQYDDKINYKHIIPYFIDYPPIYWSENNITSFSWNDYAGNLDIFCGSCVTKYNYNLDGYPVKIRETEGRQLDLEYE